MHIVMLLLIDDVIMPYISSKQKCMHTKNSFMQVIYN